MKEPWIVFYFQSKEVFAMTVHGTFPGEIEATKEQLAAENGGDPSEITVEIVTR